MIDLWRPLAALLLWVLGMVPLIAAPPLLPSLADADAMDMATSFSDTSKALDSGDLSVADAFKDATPFVRTGENVILAGVAAADGDFSLAGGLAGEALINVVQDVALKRLPGASKAFDKLRGKGPGSAKVNAKPGSAGSPEGNVGAQLNEFAITLTVRVPMRLREMGLFELRTIIVFTLSLPQRSQRAKLMQKALISLNRVVGVIT